MDTTDFYERSASTANQKSSATRHQCVCRRCGFGLLTVADIRRLSVQAAIPLALKIETVTTSLGLLSKALERFRIFLWDKIATYCVITYALNGS
jgi:hypothetical protein